MIRAVFFDVDFTLIYPGPTFRGDGYQVFCARHGMSVDPSKFDQAVADALLLLDGADDSVYDPEIFVAFTRRIIEGLGGRGDTVDACAREIYVEWASCHHFELYEEVPSVLRALASQGMRLGLISNSHRCLASFQSHFDLGGLVSAAVSSLEHGSMKPHPSIFDSALRLMNVAPGEALMVGDNVRQDIEGALGVGMRAVLVHRSDHPHPSELELTARGVPVISSLNELMNLVIG
ncbi:MAG: HAD family hydrolase [Vicinamibacterales bacterium]